MARRHAERTRDGSELAYYVCYLFSGDFEMEVYEKHVLAFYFKMQRLLRDFRLAV